MEKKLRLVRAVLLAVCIFLTGIMQRAEAVSTIEQDYMCAWLSLASYNDRLGQIARSELAAAGWNMEPFHEKNVKADTQFYLVRQDQPGGKAQYMLSIMGTSTWKDIENDLSLTKIPFGGKTPEEFAAEAARTTMTAKEPLVHSGFNTYTQTAFFTNKINGWTMGELLCDELLAHPESRICITGHSLGGAVSVLLAARLVDMGVPAEQIDVVTFGAPAVGNDAFAKKFEKLNVRRVTMSGDPVKAVLQSLRSGYTQFGEKRKLTAPKGSEREAHAMVGYVDGIMREYYDTIPADFTLAPGDSPRVFLAVSAGFDEPVAGDAPYLARAAAELLSHQIDGLVVGSEVPDTFAGIAAAARANGCRYALVQQYETERQRESRGYHDYEVMLTETVLDTKGNVVSVQQMTTSTKRMPVVLAGLYNTVAGKEMREAVLNASE
ncbi:MAG: lipase family protein [Schwartzia sp.]|nr:lipase family protein [Schwartzia sp. (in: firmicutes)]